MRELAPFGVRLPIDLKEKIDKNATRNRRSINSEILAQIEAAYAAQDARIARSPLCDYATGELLEELIRRFGTEGLVIQIAKKQDIP